MDATSNMEETAISWKVKGEKLVAILFPLNYVFGFHFGRFV